MGEVHVLFPAATVTETGEPDRDPDPAVIDMLETALEEARSGRIRAAALTVATFDEHGGVIYECDARFEYTWHLTQLLVGLSLQKKMVLETIQANVSDK